MKKLTPTQKAKLLKLESQKFKNHAQALKSLSELENGADHALAKLLLSQIEVSLSNLKQVIEGNGKSKNSVTSEDAENLFQDICGDIAKATFGVEGIES